MSDNEMNSAEREAEKILQEAYPEARAEDCPQGDQCAVHFRVDEEYIDESEKYGRFITYFGDFAVITEDNHLFDDPQFLIQVLLGLKQPPERYETTILYVGDGAIADIHLKSPEEQRKTFRYSKTHDDWETLRGQHSATVVLLESGLVDVSKSIYPEA